MLEGHSTFLYIYINPWVMWEREGGKNRERERSRENWKVVEREAGISSSAVAAVLHA